MTPLRPFRRRLDVGDGNALFCVSIVVLDVQATVVVDVRDGAVVIFNKRVG